MRKEKRMTIILNALYFANKNRTRKKYPIYLFVGVFMDALVLTTYAIQISGK